MIKEETQNGKLSDSSRRVLIQQLERYIRRTFNETVGKPEKIAVATATVNLFPSLKVKNSLVGGIDLIYNPNTGKGYLVSKIKNANFKRKKFATSPENKTLEENLLQQVESEEKFQEDIKFLQNAIVPQQVDHIINILNRTIEKRRKVIQDNTNQSFDFPFYFIDPSLVRRF